ncbi:hypothetical protein BH20ACI1_BH20ACI1_14310 [soil metagenome]
MRSKTLLLFLIFFASALSLNCQTKAVNEKVKPCKFLSFADAEKILGQTVELVTNSWNFADDKSKFGCTYRSIEKDEASGREINLFFTLEESSTEEQGEKIYEDIWNSNKNRAGIEVLSGIGDEAYSHSDKPNFHFIMARKGKFTIRLKINKAVETTSLKELKAFAKKVAEQV